MGTPNGKNKSACIAFERRAVEQAQDQKASAFVSHSHATVVYPAYAGGSGFARRNDAEFAAAVSVCDRPR